MKPTPSQPEQEILKLLEALKSARAEYPPDLLAKRRTALIAQYGRLEKGVKDSRSSEKDKVIEVLGDLNRVRAKYPAPLLARQRAEFISQAAKHRKLGWMENLRSVIRNWFPSKPKVSVVPTRIDLRRSITIVSLLVVAFAGILIFGNPGQATEFSGSHLTQREISQPIRMEPTAIYAVTKTTCAPDSQSSPCSVHGFVNGPDRESWVSDSADNWIKLDTGQVAAIHKVELDRKYLNSSSGDFTISVALTENQYKQVYDSRTDNMAGAVVRLETIQVSFEPVLARFVMVRVVDPGMIINEVRAFSVIQPPAPYQTTKDPVELPPPTSRPSNTPLPINSPVPTRTTLPTNPPVPTSTSTPVPTDTPAPTDTALPTDTLWPTNTPMPTDTQWPTSTPVPTNSQWPTSTPMPTDTQWPTSTPMPTDTLWPTGTSLPVPPVTPTLSTPTH